MSNDTISQSIEITPLASAKIVCHALRFPHSQIHGILVGTFQDGGQVTNSRTLTIEDSIPICHSSPTKPIIDMAIRLIEAHFDDNVNLSKKIVGWYTANERNDEDMPGHAALKIVSTLSDYVASDLNRMSSEIVLISLKSKGLRCIIEKNKDESLFKVYGKDSSKKQWLREYHVDRIVYGNSDRLLVPVLPSIVSDAKASTLKFFDFESHLDGGVMNIQESDWINNSALAKLIE